MPAALVTGAGRGIGRATTLALAAAGHAVVVAEIRPVLAAQALRTLRRHGASAVAIRTDVGDPASAAHVVRATLRRFGRLDVLVNNAGVLTTGPLAGLRVRALRRMVDVNLLGPLVVTRAALPAMLRQGSATIVNVASQLGRTGIGDYVTYCATKFGVVGLTEALAEELAGSGVRVYAVCPGLVDTPMARRAGIAARDRAGLIRPETVARAIVGLATGARRAPSGAAIDVTP